MKHSRTPLTSLLAGIGAAMAAAFSPSQSPAQSFDMDCKVILCLAGGFPPECGDALDDLRDRLMSFPPKPPFGLCAMADGSGYSDFLLDAGWLTGRAQWTCPAPGQILILTEGDHGERDMRAACYERQVCGQMPQDEDDCRLTGEHPALRHDYALRITLEPGTAEEYRSETFRVRVRGR